jgi:hypothetical protein
MGWIQIIFKLVVVYGIGFILWSTQLNYGKEHHVQWVNQLNQLFLWQFLWAKS